MLFLYLLVASLMAYGSTIQFLYVPSSPKYVPFLKALTIAVIWPVFVAVLLLVLFLSVIGYAAYASYVAYLTYFSR